MNFLNRLVPFFFMGIMLFLLILGIIFVYYLLVFGAIIGLVLFVISWVRNKLFPPPPPVIKPQQSESQRAGRIIDHDE